MSALLYGIVYYITIPSMYMLLVIYSIFNMNDVSWGTRENAAPVADVATAKQVFNLYFEFDIHFANKKKFAKIQRTFHNRVFNELCHT